MIDVQYKHFQLNNKFDRVVRISDLYSITTETFNPKKSSELKVLHFSIPSLDSNNYPVVDEVESIKSNKNIINEFSVLFSKLNPSTKRVWIPFSKYPLLSVSSPEFLSITGKNQSDQAVIFAIINSEDFQNYFKSHATGTTNSRQRTRPDAAYNYELFYDEVKFADFGSQISPLIEQLQVNLDEIQHLISIRELLLPKLMYGEFSVVD